MGSLRGERRCAAGGCAARHYAQEYCKKHYAQVLRHGRLTPERERGAVRHCPAKESDGSLCNRTDTVHGYCRKHHRQLSVHGRLTPEREHVMGHEGCSVPRCREPHRAKGYCTKHYNRQRWLALKGKARTAARTGPKARRRRARVA